MADWTTNSNKYLGVYIEINQPQTTNMVVRFGICSSFQSNLTSSLFFKQDRVVAN